MEVIDGMFRRRLPLSLGYVTTKRCVARACSMLLLVAGVAFAHPMGNFSVSHYSRLSVSESSIRLEYVLDLAEIPTFQELQGVGASPERLPAGVTLQNYAGRKAQESLTNLSILRDGAPLQWRLMAARAEFAEGAGGLPTMKIYVQAEAPASLGGAEILYRDGNFPGRAGWKEIVVRSSGADLTGAESLGSELSNGLAAYPADPLANPPQVLQAAFRVNTDGVVNAARSPVSGLHEQPSVPHPPIPAARAQAAPRDVEPSEGTRRVPQGSSAPIQRRADASPSRPNTAGSAGAISSSNAASFSDASAKFQWGSVTRGDFLSQILSGREIGRAHV